MKNNDLTPGEWEKIIINRAFGMSTEENAKAMGLTRNGVLNVLMIVFSFYGSHTLVYKRGLNS